MSRAMTTHSRASALSSSLILAGFAAMTLTGHFWPWLMLVIGLPLALRQFLLGRHHDAFVSLVVFGGIFITAQWNVSWNVLLPVLFITASIYVLFREFVLNRPTYQESEESHNIELEIDAEEHHKK